MDAWEIDMDDWIDLKRSSEVYQDIKQGLRVGERYQINGFKGRKIGTIALDTVEELRFSLTKGLSQK